MCNFFLLFFLYKDGFVNGKFKFCTKYNLSQTAILKIDA